MTYIDIINQLREQLKNEGVADELLNNPGFINSIPTDSSGYKITNNGKTVCFDFKINNAFKRVYVDFAERDGYNEVVTSTYKGYFMEMGSPLKNLEYHVYRQDFYDEDGFLRDSVSLNNYCLRNTSINNLVYDLPGQVMAEDFAPLEFRDHRGPHSSDIPYEFDYFANESSTEIRYSRTRDNPNLICYTSKRKGKVDEIMYCPNHSEAKSEMTLMRPQLNIPVISYDKDKKEYFSNVAGKSVNEVLEFYKNTEFDWTTSYTPDFNGIRK